MEYKEVGGSKATYVKPNAMKIGQSVEGIYAGSYTDQYEKQNFRLTQSDGTTTIINGTALLASKFADIAEGTPVKVVYEGKSKLTKGKYAGKEAHAFKVLVAQTGSKSAKTAGLPF